MLTALVTFSAAAMLIVLLPGPDTLVVLRSLLRDGRPSAAFTVAGVLTGLAVWVAAAALGLAALLRASSDAYLVLRVVGGLYLLWLGINSLRSRGTALPIPAATPELASSGRRLGSGFRAGLATDLLNPKVGVFFITFLPGFIPAGYSVGGISVVLGGIFIVETAIYFAVLLLLAGRVTGWMQNPTVRRRLDRITGVILIGFGLRLVIERA